MRILRDYRATPAAARGAVAAIGNFDGVHRGHRVVIERACAIAGQTGTAPAVVTFEPHPRAFFQPGAPPFRLSTLATKAADLARLGVDTLFVIDFDAAFAAKSAETFVREVLVGHLGLAHVVVGYDFVFGQGRQGNAELLGRLAVRHGFGASIVEPVTQAGTAFSSTRVRELLRGGQPREAAAILGHFWTIEGEVLGGDRRGRTIGFPTANVTLGPLLQPAFGVYAVRAGIAREDGPVDWRPGVANLGRRPTFDKQDVLLEVHLLDFAGDIYGQHLWVQFVEFLRPEKRFESLDALKRQIEADAGAARALLARTDATDPADGRPVSAGP
ncbi:MAG: bifunctional riboflavin kinase/FAD synthetase [Alphaproteobacteria bacterium]|nr:bifunctional riboflavin kinase/FAD synthetase [Alphaproteobacteria bacterium]